MAKGDTVRVKLSEEELAERANDMATKVEHIRVLRAKKKSDAKATQDLIDEELDELEAMASTVLDGEEEADQADLFVDAKRKADEPQDEHAE